eukprot:244342_1
MSIISKQRKQKRINISNNELKYQKLLQKHRKLQHEFSQYKETHERKVSLLRCQLKHTLKFVGVKLQNLETKLQWYQKQWKYQQDQFPTANKCKTIQRNKCIQTNIDCTIKSSTLKNTKKCKKSIRIPTPAIIKSTKIKSPKLKLNCNSENYIDSSSLISDIHNDINYSLISSNPFNNTYIKNDINPQLKSPIHLYNNSMANEAITKHNQLITRLRARLDTMSDILVSTREKIHKQREFDSESVAKYIVCDDNNLSSKSILEDNLSNAVIDAESDKFGKDKEVIHSENIEPTDPIEINKNIAIETIDCPLLTSTIATIGKQAKSVDLLPEYDIDEDVDFQDVVNTVTEKMSILSNKLRSRPSSCSISTSTSDIEDCD